MSSNPVTEFEQYRHELLAALGDDDPVAVVRATQDDVAALVEGASRAQLTRSPGPGEWSPHQVLSHLADADLMVTVRVRMIVTQHRPILVGYDQDAWTARFGGLESDPRETLVRWQTQRRACLRIVESLTQEEWERVGVHTERGEESARLTVQLMAGHDRVHLDQFRRGLTSR